MARPSATAEQRRQASEAIRRAAVDLSVEGGVASITARSVAERAGVSVGTLYSHFDNLGDLMRSLWTPVIAEAGQKLATIAASYPNPIDRVQAMLVEYTALVLGNEALHRNTLLFVRPTNDPAPQQLPPDELDLHRLLTEAIREGQDAGLIIDGEAVQLTQLLWAGVHGALALPVNADLYALEPAEQQVVLMIDLLVASLRCPSSA